MTAWLVETDRRFVVVVADRPYVATEALEDIRGDGEAVESWTFLSPNRTIVATGGWSNGAAYIPVPVTERFPIVVAGDPETAAGLFGMMPGGDAVEGVAELWPAFRR